jgi:hypothetical protein
VDLPSLLHLSQLTLCGALPWSQVVLLILSV